MTNAPRADRDAPLPRFGRADLQIHTAHGDGMDDARTIFERVESRAELDVIAITDHDDVRGALEAREVYRAGSWHFELITGIEVTTIHGHLLALFVDQPVRSFRRIEETIASIHAIGGLAVIPHPFSLLTRSVGRRTLDRVLRIADPSTHPDGIEIANPIGRGWDTGARAAMLNRSQWHLAETGGSDAHFAESVGRAVTLYPGRGAADLRRAILERTTVARLEGKTPYRMIGARKLVVQQARGLAVTPRKVLGPVLGRWRASLIERARR